MFIKQNEKNNFRSCMFVLENVSSLFFLLQKPITRMYIRDNNVME